MVVLLGVLVWLVVLARVVAVVLAGPSTEVPLRRASTARLPVVPAASAIDEPACAVLERQHDLLAGGVVRVPPVGEEHPNVLEELVPQV
jgi:hypothetical protein